MREFFRSIVHALEAEQPVVLVSILTSGGSTPRGTGAMMAVFPDGSIAGTIGGGNVEFTAQKLAGELLRSGENATRSYRFVQGDAASLGMVCGGDVCVHFQYLSPGDGKIVSVLRELVNAAAQNTGVWFLRRLDGDAVTDFRCAVTGDRSNAALAPLLTDKPLLREDGWLSIPVEKPGRVYLFGGGHVSRELVPVIARVGFRPVVYDDRPEFTDPELFPQAVETLCGDFLKLSEQITVTADDYVVIMTRGHQADYEVLTQTLRSGAKYLGCIGSRKKLALCKERLLNAGFTETEYARVHAPIGLSIGAETPEEIAVAIAGELIAVRAGALK
jgi:xanthine dehydrogenase accessory factor